MPKDKDDMPPPSDLANQILDQVIGDESEYDDGLGPDARDDGIPNTDDRGDESDDRQEQQERQPQQRERPTQDDRNRQRNQRQQQQRQPPQQRPAATAPVSMDIFDPQVRLREDQAGNLYNDQNQIVARAGRERNMFEGFRARARQSDQAALRMAGNLRQIADAAKEIKTRYDTLKAQRGAFDNLGLSFEDQTMVIDFVTTYRRDPIAGLKKILTAAAVRGVDLKPLTGATGNPIDLSAIVETIDAKIAERLKPVTETHQRQAAEETSRSLGRQDAEEFYINNPDAHRYAQQIGPQNFANMIGQVKAQYPDMPLNEIWLRMKNAMQAARQRQGRRPAQQVQQQRRQGPTPPVGGQNQRRQPPRNQITQSGIPTIEEIGRSVLADLTGSRG